MISLHKLVQRDARRALRGYDLVSRELGDRFWTELLRTLDAVATHPERCHYDRSGFRRANLKIFPWHVLFFEELDGVRVIALRHHRQNPKFGIRRR